MDRRKSPTGVAAALNAKRLHWSRRDGARAWKKAAVAADAAAVAAARNAAARTVQRVWRRRFARNAENGSLALDPVTMRPIPWKHAVALAGRYNADARPRGKKTLFDARALAEWARQSGRGVRNPFAQNTWLPFNVQNHVRNRAVSPEEREQAATLKSKVRDALELERAIAAEKAARNGRGGQAAIEDAVARGVIRRQYVKKEFGVRWPGVRWGRQVYVIRIRLEQRDWPYDPGWVYISTNNRVLLKIKLRADGTLDNEQPLGDDEPGYWDQEALRRLFHLEPQG